MTYLQLKDAMQKYNYRTKVLGRGKDVFIVDEYGSFIAEVSGVIKGKVKYTPNGSYLNSEHKEEIISAIDKFANTSLLSRRIYSVA